MANQGIDSHGNLLSDQSSHVLKSSTVLLQYCCNISREQLQYWRNQMHYDASMM